MTKYWIGVASRNHVKICEAGGFCQLCHGKAAQVHRLLPGDWLVYYSPRMDIKEGERVQAFTAIGCISPSDVYRVRQTETFCPARRDVDYIPSLDAPIAPLLKDLSFSSGGANWGLQMRRGVFEIQKQDFQIIAEATSISPNDLLRRK